MLPAITLEHDGDARTVIVRLVGDHDLATSPTLADVLRDASMASEARVVDLTDCTFVDSSIIVALLHAGGVCPPVLLIPDGSPVWRALEIAGVDRVLPVAATRADALCLAAAKRPPDPPAVRPVPRPLRAACRPTFGHAA